MSAAVIIILSVVVLIIIAATIAVVVISRKKSAEAQAPSTQAPPGAPSGAPASATSAPPSGAPAPAAASQSPEMYPIPAATTWAVAQQICSNKGKKLCNKKDICPEPLKPPIDGMRIGDEWTPVDDEANTWVSIGNMMPEVRLCKSHKEVIGIHPTWGTDPDPNNPYRKRVYCCAP